MSTSQSLLDMGFPAEKVEKAISACGDNIEQAMEWILAHAEESVNTTSAETGTSKPEDASQDATCDPPQDATSDPPQEKNSEGEDAQDSEAKSLKCDECGKLFRSSEEVEFHAVKTGHSSFSESTEERTPLTEDQKQEKLREIEDKLKQRRREKAEEERREAIEREKKRIQMSRDIAETKRRVEEQEMKKLAEERRREKMEDKMARERVKEQIERDKIARKEMFGGVSNSSSTTSSSSPAVTAPSQPQQPQQSTHNPPQKKEYDSTRLQMRLPSGPPLVQEFRSKEPLSAVRLWIRLNRKDSEDPSPSFTLSTTFPRKVFDEEDMDKPLNILGLVPSAVLVVMDN